MPKITDAPFTLREKIETAVARLLYWVPSGVQQAIALGRKTMVAGEQLDPGMRLLLKIRDAREPITVDLLPTNQARAYARREALIHAGPLIEVGSVRDLEIPGPAGPMAARHYIPPGARPGERLPMLLFMHGGGFVLGDIDTHDPPCRMLCREAGIQVMSLDYRLAPENPFPAALDDAEAAILWIAAHADELGVDPERLAVGGDSSGGTLATVAAGRLVRTRAPVRLKAQLLLYPAVDRARDFESLRLFGEGFYITRQEIEWYFGQYAGGVPNARKHPEISPLEAPDLHGQPRAVIMTAAFDPLRDEAEEYARALRDAGVAVELRRAPGLIHGFINMTAINRPSRVALVESAQLLRQALGA